MELPNTTPNADNAAPAQAEAAAPAAAPAPAASDNIQGYCVKCKANRQMTQVQIVTTQNGRKAAKGVCPACGTTVMKFLPNK